MRNKKTAIIIVTLFISVMLVGFGIVGHDEIPKLWDVKKLKSGYLPLADRSIEVQPISEKLYYKIPERVAYKTYPLYMPGREPNGYYEWLLHQQPEVAFDVSKIKSEDDWIKAGEIIYNMPQAILSFMDSAGDMKGVQRWGDILNSIHAPITKEGIVPFVQLVVRQKGKIELGFLACALCHDRVMPDGSVLEGGQGNFPFDHWWGNSIMAQIKQMTDSQATVWKRDIFRQFYSAPWNKNESQDFITNPDAVKAVSMLMATVPGVMHRHGTTLGAPAVIPDLFNAKERKYLDRTGLALQRDIGDMMRYAVLNQEMDFSNSYNGFMPIPSSDSDIVQGYTRFSDAQAYALAKYIYSLKPPSNPNKESSELIAKGKIIFEDEACSGCHTPPFYSSNKLTPALGFTPSKEDKANFDIIDISVKTDPKLALYSRRGTGYYKVPSLIGVWNRSALLHGGYVTSLEEMFDSARLKDDFMPSGFNPNIDKPFAVTGHIYGLSLSAEDKKALIAFLRSL